MLHSIEVDAAPLEALPHSVASVAVVCYLPLRDVVALTIASRRLRDRCVASLDYWRTASTLSRMALARSVWVEEDLSAAVRRMRRHESLRGRGLRLGGQSLMERHVHSVLGAIWMAAPISGVPPTVACTASTPAVAVLSRTAAQASAACCAAFSAVAHAANAFLSFFMSLASEAGLAHAAEATGGLPAATGKRPLFGV